MARFLKYKKDNLLMTYFWNINQLTAVIHIETDRMVFSVDQMTGFYIKCNTELILVKSHQCWQNVPWPCYDVPLDNLQQVYTQKTWHEKSKYFLFMFTVIYYAVFCLKLLEFCLYIAGNGNYI